MEEITAADTALVLMREGQSIIDEYMGRFAHYDDPWPQKSEEKIGVVVYVTWSLYLAWADALRLCLKDTVPITEVAEELENSPLWPYAVRQANSAEAAAEPFIKHIRRNLYISLKGAFTTSTISVQKEESLVFITFEDVVKAYEHLPQAERQERIHYLLKAI